MTAVPGSIGSSNRYSRRPKLSQTIADDIAERIVRGEYESGQLLPTESEMISSYGVSRGTLREALRLVESYGLIHLRAGRDGGPVAQKPDLSRVAYNFSLNLRSLGIPFGEVLDSRRLIEPVLAAQAALRRTDHHVERLQSAQAHLAEVVDDADAFSVGNCAFHTLIAQASANRPLAMLWQAISSVADGHDIGARYSETQKHAVVHAHDRVMAAVIDRDAEGAASAMTKHLDAMLHAIEAEQPELLERPIPRMP